MRAIQIGFCREKLCFLISSAAAASALYYMLVSGPMVLQPGAPVSVSETRPAAFARAAMLEKSDAEWYVYSGVDAQTGAHVNRDRHNPFAPYRDVCGGITEQKKIKNPDVVPPPDSGDQAVPPRNREFAPVALASAVEYTGVVSANGVTIGLLNRKDGSGYLRVTEGSEFAIAGVSYRVDALEKQAICVSQGDVSIRLKCN